MRIALAQLNATVGDLEGNFNKMAEAYRRALDAGVDLLVFPEQFLCGYPTEDLLLKQHFLDHNLELVEKLAATCPKLTIVAGFAEPFGGGCRNSAAICRDGEIDDIYAKNALPNYGVFDERRYFEAGTRPVAFEVAGVKVAMSVCFDMWNVGQLTEFLRPLGRFDLLLNISASPFHIGKIAKRREIIKRCAAGFRCAAAYCNLVGGQDEIVFDGRSILANSAGRIVAEAAAFEEDMLIADVTVMDDGHTRIEPIGPPVCPPESDVEEVYRALVLGTRDYTRKNGFSRTMLGLSGGIDSSVVAAIAAAALGPECVTGITMPSRFNSAETRGDAELLAKNLGIAFHSIPIESILGPFHEALSAIPGWNDKGLAYENLQARIRGCILMSLSNQFGALVFTTGNKSETAVGYATLYGDTAGGFAVIKDLPKTLVYRLAEYINQRAGRAVIPPAVITRPPSAELRPDQKDTDSLPDYDLLDSILKGYVEQDKSPGMLSKEGLPRDVVHRVVRLIDQNEYKRRLSPPGIKITPKAFGKDRRLPITNRYRYDRH